MTIGGQWNSRLALFALTDGRLMVLAIGRDGRLYGKSQVEPGGPLSGEWRLVGSARPGGDPYLDAGTRVSYAVERSGVLTVFANCPGGRVGYAYLVPGEGWSQWRSMWIPGTPATAGVVASGRMASAPPILLVDGAAGEITVGSRPDAADPDGWQAAEWAEVDRGATRPTLGVTDSGAGRSPRVVLFAVGERRDIWTCSTRPDVNEPISICDSIGREWVPGIATRTPGARVAGRLVPVTADGVVWRGENGDVWSAVLKAPGILSEVRDLGFAVIDDPVAATGPGVAVLAGRTETGRIAVWRRQGGRDWTPAGLTAAYPTVPAVAEPAIALGADGLADVLFLGGDRRIHHVRETSAPSATDPATRAG
ncbi:MAG: hypothetical protein V7637_5212 [Mycobacteriales bacterium]|jgi:hypothetical protein